MWDAPDGWQYILEHRLSVVMESLLVLTWQEPFACAATAQIPVLPLAAVWLLELRMLISATHLDSCISFLT